MINTNTLADGAELLNTADMLLSKPLITKQMYNDIKYALNEYLLDINRAKHNVVRITCAGNYNSGKSSVLNALTGGDNFKVGDVPTTSSIDEFEHDGFIYVDTPGLNANHFDNKTAQKAFKDADVILFISNILGGGLYSSEADYLKKISNILGGSDNMKAQTIFALSNLHQVEDELVQKIVDEYAKNIESTLGFKPDKIITYDAVTYETGIKEGKDLLVKTSGIDELKNEIALAGKRFSSMSESISEQRISAKGIALENELNKAILSFEERISKLVKQSEARTVDKGAVDLAIERCRKIVGETKKTINPPSTDTVPEVWFHFPNSNYSSIEEKTKFKVKQRIMERLRKVYDSRERVVLEAANEALEKIRSITTFDKMNSNFFFSNENKAMNALLSCNEQFKKADVVLPVELLKPIEYEHKVFPIDETSIIGDLTYGTVNYDYPYSLDDYYSEYCEIHKIDYNGIFNIKYECWDTFSATYNIGKDVERQFNSNFRPIWNRYASKLGDFCESIKAQLDSRLESMIQEAESIAGTSGNDINSEINSLKSHIDSIKKYIK